MNDNYMATSEPNCTVALAKAKDLYRRRRGNYHRCPSSVNDWNTKTSLTWWVETLRWYQRHPRCWGTVVLISQCPLLTQRLSISTSHGSTRSLRQEPRHVGSDQHSVAEWWRWHSKPATQLLALLHCAKDLVHPAHTENRMNVCTETKLIKGYQSEFSKIQLDINKSKICHTWMTNTSPSYLSI